MTAKMKVSDDLLREYKTLNPTGKGVPPNKLRDEAWVTERIGAFKLLNGELATPASPQAEEKPAETKEEPKYVPTVQLPTATLKGEKPESVDQVMTKDMKATKKALDDSPRVMFMIPKAEWEEVGVYETVTINGYRMVIKKGVMVELPRPVFDILANKYNVEMSAGMGNRLDVNPDKDPSLAK